MTSPKSRPILFSAPMIRAILEGRKTQTRRVVKLGVHQPPAWEHCNGSVNERMAFEQIIGQKCPHGQPTETLWVRETTIISPKRWNDGNDCTHTDADGDRRIVQYLATHPSREAADDYKLKATPSIFMPRWASRITLEIISVRVERLQDISEADAKAEGCNPALPVADERWVCGYQHLWDSINGKTFPWSSNCWVWVIEFRKIENQ